MAQAIRRFRGALGDTQRQFARRLGAALTSVGRYETNAQPSGEILKRLGKVAQERNLPLFEEIFLGRLPPDTTEFIEQELSAIRYLVIQTLDRLGPGSADMRRGRLLLAIRELPDKKLRAAEAALDRLIKTSLLDDIINRSAGALVRNRSREVEEARIEYLRTRTPEAFRTLYELNKQHS